MTQEQAQTRAAELNSLAAVGEHWFVREGNDGRWEIASASVVGMRRSFPLRAATESRPTRDLTPDPRPSVFRAVPPYGAG
jgi:hypothetical protein